MIDLKEFEISDLKDYLKTYSWLTFIINNPNTDDQMYSEFENMIYRMSNVLFYYITEKKIEKKILFEIINELEKENYNGLGNLYEIYVEEI